MPTIAERLDDFFALYTPPLNKGLRENRVERMRLLLGRLDHPEETFQAIHIAGSKGKGTTATTLSLMLRELGKKCGLYLSPHVYDVRERFTVAGTFLPDETYLSTMEYLEERIQGFRLPEEYGPERPTTFELYTAFAYCLFRTAGCDYAVIETGMGGRLDATNTLSPIATAITRIEKEHTQVLGDTLQKIAGEKSGIMRPGVPCFLLEQEEETMEVFQRKAAELSAPLHTFSFDPSFDWDIPVKKKGTINGKEYSLAIETFEEVTILDAFFSLTILDTLDLVPKEKTSFTLTSATGFSMPARYEVRGHRFQEDKDRKTTLILDGAHTKESMKAFRETLHADQQGKEKELPLIFSLAEDKDIEAIAKEIIPAVGDVVITTIGEYKKCKPERILQVTSTLFPEKRITLEPSPLKALLLAARKAQRLESPTILVAGSFYLCSEIDKALREVGYGD